MATNLISKVEGELKLNTVRGPLDRRCSRCQERYLRRNVVEMWTDQNEGSRWGWHKDIAKICLKCQPIHESEKIMGIADVKFSKIYKPQKRK